MTNKKKRFPDTKINIDIVFRQNGKIIENNCLIGLLISRISYFNEEYFDANLQINFLYLTCLFLIISF